MTDRFTRGLVAGIIAGVFSNVWAFLAGAMNFTTLRYADWAGIIIFGRTPPFTAGELVFATAAQIMFVGGLGILFAYLLPFFTERYYFLKGWIFSVMTWFLIYAVTSLFKVEGIVGLPLKTVLSNFVDASILGLVLAYSLLALHPAADKEREVFSARGLPQPAAKPLPENAEQEKGEGKR